MTGMQPLTIASNNLADDGVSPAGFKQNVDLKMKQEIQQSEICNGKQKKMQKILK